MNEFTVKYPVEAILEWMTKQAVRDEIIQPEYQTLSIQDITYDSHEGYMIVDGTITTESVN